MSESKVEKMSQAFPVKVLPKGYIIKQLSENVHRVEGPEGFYHTWRTHAECLETAIQHSQDGSYVSHYD